MEKKEYYLGLDMGTSTVGWAVTDANYNLLRAKGKDLWGIREFEEAKTSVDRRTNRVSRRRRQREVARIGLLKMYFEEEIRKIDPFFFERLENSKYYLEDKDERVSSKSVLFNEKNYTDRDYFKEYPTIFHLRKDLLENLQPHDVRMVYLAILNMFKHRGHFLNASLSADDSNTSIEDTYKEFEYSCSEILGISFPQNIDYAKFTDILASRDFSKTVKAEKVAALFNIEKREKNKFSFIKLICGLKAESKALFNDMEESDSKVSICFADANFDEKQSEIIEAIGEERYSVIENAHSVYNVGALSGILKNCEYLSQARVADYNKHKEDLKRLKAVVRKYGKEEQYELLFRSYEQGTYSAYAGSVNSKGVKERRNISGRKQEDLYKTIKGILAKYPQNNDVIAILDDIDKETFLPKQLTTSNGVIPNQVHAKELKKILSNASEYLPFLKEKDESGLTVSERIESLFSFQIPYYIGPVNDKSKRDGGNGWVVRKNAGPVYPWNFEEKIDTTQTRVNFIKNLIRECTYLQGEKVLPKTSLLYERYCVLNEINNLKVLGEPISVEIKQELYTSLFERGKKVTRKQIEKWFFAKGLITDGAEITGIDENVNNYLSTYGKFLPIFGEKLKEDKYKGIVEDIVSLSTIYGDAKGLLKKIIKEKYSNVLSDENIERILGYKFKDWGRFSREFLELPGCNKEDGEEVTIIRELWETNYNLMELLNNEERFTFKQELESRRNKAYGTISEFKYEDLNEMYFSAPVKRMVWQTILVIRELEEILGCGPTRLFVEMTRKEDDVKKRTKTRKQKFTELYKNVKEEQKYWLELIESSDASGKLNSKKMYLYLTQMGKCMYSGEDIELDKLFDDNLYDIDHIYPRHFVKDDNIDNNLVLVKKQINAHKSDAFPLEQSIYESQKNRWKGLRELGFISEEKYSRLMRREELTPEQKADFIARQLVETAQGTKGVAELIKKLMPETVIVYSKASNVSDFRNERKIYKSRLVNDFHHAHDAYLNIVVGNVYYTKFTQSPINFIRGEYAQGQKYNLGRMFDFDVARNGKFAWVAAKKDGEPGTIATVKNVLSKQTPLLTRMNFEQHGGIANATLYGKKKASPDNYISLKSSDEKMSDVTKYGGFTSATGAYFFLVEHEKKGKKIRTIETLPLYMKDKVEKIDGALEEYCKNVLELKNPVIRMRKIKFQSLIKKDGYFVHIAGRTVDRLILRNAVSLHLNNEDMGYAHECEKVCSGKKSSLITEEKNKVFFKYILSRIGHGIWEKRPNSITEKVKEKVDKFATLSYEKQCYVICQILNLSVIGNAVADLSDIELAPKSGVMLMNKNITDLNECSLINQSVTGLFSTEIDLLTV